MTSLFCLFTFFTITTINTITAIMGRIKVIKENAIIEVKIIVVLD